VSCGRAPRIVEHPTDTAVELHEPATLNCKSEGQPQPDIRWYRDGRPVDAASSVRKALLPDGSLLFLEASQGKRDSDSGTYWCIASNAFGEAISRKANLVVKCKYKNIVVRLAPLLAFINVFYFFVTFNVPFRFSNRISSL